MATRLFLPIVQQIPVISTPDAAWQFLDDQRWRPMLLAHGSDTPTAGQNIGVWTAGQFALGDQFISPPMSAGVVFTSGSTTVKGMTQALEVAGTDNVNKCIAGVRIISEDAGTVRATLLAVANYTTTTEFATSHRNKFIFDGDAITASWTTLFGDRICLEVGMSDNAGTTPNGTFKWGTSGTDLAENETGTSAGVSWLEFSNTITFVPEGARKSMISMCGCGGTT